MDLTKKLAYAEELARDFKDTYRSVFGVAPDHMVLDYGWDSLLDSFTTLKSREQLSLHAPSMWSYFFNGYTDLWKEHRVINEEVRSSLEVRTHHTSIIVRCDDPLKTIGFFDTGFRTEFPYELSIYNLWMELDDPEPISLRELYSLLYIHSLIWRRVHKTTIDHVIALPWPDDEYMQGIVFNSQVSKVLDTVPGSQVISTTLVKNTWDPESYTDRFQDNGYRVIECLPNDIFHSPMLMEYFFKVCNKKNIAVEYPYSPLIISALGCFSNKADDTYKDFKSMLWHYVYSKSVHVLLFIEESTVIGHLEYTNLSDHSIKINSYAFLDANYEKQYSTLIMDEFMYDCYQGNTRVVTVKVNSEALREYFEAYEFKVAEVNIIPKLPE